VIIPVVLILIAIADALLEMGMLAIFLVPLWVHAKEMGTGVPTSRDAQATSIGETNAKTVHSKIEGVIRRNIICSSIALASCCIGLTTLAALEWIANLDGTWHTAHLRIWASFAIAFDNFIGVTAIHCMTSGWLPSILQSTLSMRTADGSATSTNRGDKNGKVASTSGNDERNTHQSATGGTLTAVNPKYSEF
jgi:hypothetical protein